MITFDRFAFSVFINYRSGISGNQAFPEMDNKQWKFPYFLQQQYVEETISITKNYFYSNVFMQ